MLTSFNDLNRKSFFLFIKKKKIWSIFIIFLEFFQAENSGVCWLNKYFRNKWNIFNISFTVLSTFYLVWCKVTHFFFFYLDRQLLSKKIFLCTADENIIDAPKTLNVIWCAVKVFIVSNIAIAILYFSLGYLANALQLCDRKNRHF